MIISSLIIVTPPDSGRQIQRAFRSLLSFARLQAGCLACNVYQDLENPDTIVMEEKWQTAKDLHRYIRSERYRKVLELMELSTIAPEINFCHVETIEGLELIEFIRS
jgi:quinol monooxygenase YgiN